MARTAIQTIAGHRLPEPRITPMAIWLSFLWVGVPVLGLTGLLDLIMQFGFGMCTGLWCFVAR